MDGSGEKIDDFAGLGSENMSAQNPVRAFFYVRFVTGLCFRSSPGRIPGRGHLHLDSELEVLLMCAGSLRPTAASGGIVKTTYGMPR